MSDAEGMSEELLAEISSLITLDDLDGRELLAEIHRLRALHRGEALSDADRAALELGRAATACTPETAGATLARAYGFEEVSVTHGEHRSACLDVARYVVAALMSERGTSVYLAAYRDSGPPYDACRAHRDGLSAAARATLGAEVVPPAAPTPDLPAGRMTEERLAEIEQQIKAGGDLWPSQLAQMSGELRASLASEAALREENEKLRAHLDAVRKAVGA